MNNHSFASLYRTGAILAAFSQASAFGDEPVGAPPWRPVATAPSWLTRLVATIERAGQAIPLFLPHTLIASLRTPRPHAFPIGNQDERRGVKRRPAAAPHVTPPGGRPLVSHFAFCDEIDPTAI